tara:strand:- start:883 stop:2091 length:1209 start_codon:yes stop_codon:yes gene_type:complete
MTERWLSSQLLMEVDRTRDLLVSLRQNETSATLQEIGSIAIATTSVLSAALRSSSKQNRSSASFIRQELRLVHEQYLPVLTRPQAIRPTQEFAGPLRKSVRAFAPGVVVALHPSPTFSSFSSQGYRTPMLSLIDRLQSNVVSLHDRSLLLNAFAPILQNHPGVAIFNYPSNEGKNPLTLATLLGAPLGHLREAFSSVRSGEAAADCSSSAAILLSDIFAARTLGPVYLTALRWQLSPLQAHTTTSTLAPLRLLLTHETLTALGHPARLPQAQHASLTQAANLLSNQPNKDQLFEEASALPGQSFSSGQYNEEVPPLLQLLRAGLPPAQYYSSGTLCWASVPAILNASASFANTALEHLGAFLKLPEDSLDATLHVRHKADALILKALELSEFGKAFEKESQP